MAVYKRNISEPNRMMGTALSLQKFVGSIEVGADRTSDFHLFKGQFIAVPVLLALAMEVALKAWWAREVKDKPVPKTHDLLKLFDGLPEQTRTRLENSHPEKLILDHLTLLPTHQGLRSLLASNRATFVDWRYPHEIFSGSYQSEELNAALSSVIDEFFNGTAR